MACKIGYLSREQMKFIGSEYFTDSVHYGTCWLHLLTHRSVMLMTNVIKVPKVF